MRMSLKNLKIFIFTWLNKMKKMKNEIEASKQKNIFFNN